MLEVSDKKRFLAGFTLIWALLILFNIRQLDNPPYWDDIIGLHAQALWYVNHDFRILELWASPTVYYTSNLYPLGIMPLLYGLMYKLLPPLAVHICGHLFNMACVAMCGVLCWSMLRRRSWLIAGVACVAALTGPIMAGQTAALGQECPLALMCMLSIYCFSRRRYTAAYLWAVGAFFIKYTGIILLLAFPVYWLFLLVFFYRVRSGSGVGKIKRQLLYSALLAGVFCAIMIMMPHGITAAPGLGIKTALLRTFAFTRIYYPLLGLNIVVAMIGALWFIVRSRPFRRDIFIVILLSIFCGGFCVAFFSHSLPLPRYFTTIIFPLTVLLFLVIPRKLALIIGLGFIILNITGINGALFPRIGAMPRSGALLERSREYLTDLEANRRLCKWLETNAFDRPILAKWPFVHMLTVPEFGYVSKPLPRVLSPYHVHECCTGVSVLEPGNFRLPPGTICVYADNDFEYMHSPVRLAPRGEVQVLYRDESLPGELLIYMLPQRP